MAEMGSFNLGFHENSVVAVAFAPGGKVLATGGKDRTVRLWDLPEGLQGAHHRTTRQWPFRPVCLAFAPDGKRLASGLDNGTVQFWGVGPELTPQMVITPPSATAAQVIHSLSISKDGALLACGTELGPMLLDVGTGAVRWSHNLGGPVESLAFDQSLQVLAAAGRKRVHLYRVATGEELPDQPPPDGETVHSVAFQNNHGRLLAWGGEGKSVRVYDLVQGVVIREFPRLGPVDWVEFSANGRLMAAQDRTGRLTVWPAEAPPHPGGVLHEVPLPLTAGQPAKLAFAPTDGRIIVLGTGTVPGRIVLLGPVF